PRDHGKPAGRERYQFIGRDFSRMPAEALKWTRVAAAIRVQPFGEQKWWILAAGVLISDAFAVVLGPSMRF
ncbi:MAG: hypothetical protein ABI992_00155, partial [Chthoniobacterales bacterium]